MVAELSLGAAAAWLYLAMAHGRFWRTRPLLLPAPALPPEASRKRIAVVVPARDEASTIERCVRSLAAQDWPGQLHVWVVDDNSSDATGALAAQAGQDRVSVLRGAPLRPGWTGKIWALEQGVQAALVSKPDYLLFTDADIEHAADSVRSLVARAEAEERDLVSVMVRLHCESPAEWLLIPAFVFFFFQLYPPRWIAQRQSRTAGAAGGCILIRPGALTRAGGVQAIRRELIDDCALARIVKRSGGSLWLGMSDRTRSIRPYREFAEVRRMISRTAFTQLRYNWLLLAGTVAGMAFLYGVPVIGSLRGEPFAMLAWLTMTAIFAPVARFYKQPVFAGMMLPVIALYYLGATVESAMRFAAGRGGQWKGRSQAASA